MSKGRRQYCILDECFHAAINIEGTNTIRHDHKLDTTSYKKTIGEMYFGRIHDYLSM